MKPAPFAYHRARSAAHAAELLRSAGPTARILAGGQSLVPSMNLRLESPGHLVDLGGATAELDYIRVEGDWLAVGAMTRQSAVEASPEVARLTPLLSEAVTHVAHPPIRHRGTVVGSVSHAAAVAELPAVALALGAEITMLSVRGERTARAVDFFTGAFSTVCESDELVTKVRFPISGQNSGHAWAEFSPRNGNFPFAGAGVALTLDGGRVAAAAIALCGVSDRPVRAKAAEEALIGRVPDSEVIAEVAALSTVGIAPRPDGDIAAHIVPVIANSVASWSYRTTIARIQVRRALTSAVHRAGESA